MISCRRARAMLLENVRDAVGEVTLLSLDHHLAGCAECRRERARWETVGSLREWQPPQLGAAARERIVKKLRAARPQAPLARRALPRPLFAFAGVALAALVALVAWPKAKPATTGPVQFADADVTYRPGAVAKLEPKTRTIHLEKGEVEVTGRAVLSVRTASYVVRFTAAHAVFAADSVRVLSGEVFVFSLDEKQLARLTAGQSWPTVAPIVSAPVAPIVNRPVVSAPVVNKPVVSAPAAPAAPKMSAAAALDRARTALADGDTALARRWIQRAVSAATSAHDRAEAELFTAESYLVEKDITRALAQYRRVSAGFSHLPEGEAAAFAVAEVLSENGGDSRTAFAEYLSRYPDGRFAREARDRLKE
jgi:hypothetical protein